MLLSAFLFAAAACSRDSTPVETLLRQADTAFKSADYGRAAYIYYRLKQRFPDLQNVRNSLGYIYLNLGWNRYAAGEFSKAISLSAETNAAAWIGLGICFSRTNDWNNAILCFSHARMQAPNEAAVYRNLGNAFFHNREFSQAARNYEHAASTGERSDKLYAAIGLSYEQGEQWNNAVKAYEQAFKLNDKNVAVVQRLALIYRDRFNNLHKTRQFYDLLKKLDPEAAKVQKAAFDSQLKNSIVTNPFYTAEATQSVVRAVSPTNAVEKSFNPVETIADNHADRYEKLAKLSLEHGTPGAAVSQYKKALDYDSKRGYLNKELARIYESSLNDLNLAMKYYERYLPFCKDNNVEYQATVVHIKSLKDTYNAQERYARRKIEEEERRKKEEIAEQHRLEEERRQEEFKKAAREPQTYNAVIEKGAEMLRQKKLADATAYFQKAITINPAYPNAYYNLGLIYVMETNFTEAITYLNQALEKNPEFAKSHLALGYVYDRLNKKPEAIEHYTLYLELAPNTPFTDRVKLWLQDNAGAK